jgi:hypothetical protein
MRLKGWEVGAGEVDEGESGEQRDKTWWERRESVRK